MQGWEELLVILIISFVLSSFILALCDTQKISYHRRMLYLTIALSILLYMWRSGTIEEKNNHIKELELYIEGKRSYYR